MRRSALESFQFLFNCGGTRVAIYIFGVIKKLQTFMIKIDYVVFQNILHEDQCIFVCVWTNFRSTFFTLIEVTAKYAFWMYQSFSSNVEKHSYVIYFWCMGRKKVIRCQIRAVWQMTHQFDVLAFQKILFLIWCLRARIVLVKNYALLLLLFLNFSNNFCQTNCHMPFRIDHPGLL